MELTAVVLRGFDELARELDADCLDLRAADSCLREWSMLAICLLRKFMNMEKYSELPESYGSPCMAAVLFSMLCING